MTRGDVAKSISTAAAIGVALVALALCGQYILEGVVRAVIKEMNAPAIEAPRPAPLPRTFNVRLGSAPVLEVADLSGQGRYPLATTSRGERPSATPAEPLAPRGKNPSITVAPATPQLAVPGPAPPAVTAPPAVVTAPATSTPPAAAAAPEMSPHRNIAEAVADAWQQLRGKLPSPVILIALLCAAVAGVVARNGPEFLAIQTFHIMEWIARTEQSLQNRRRERRCSRERRFYLSLTEEAFHADIERRNTRIDRSTRFSEILYSQADRLEISWLKVPYIVARLRRSAAWYLETAERDQAELGRLETFWSDLEPDRRTAKSVEDGKRVVKQLRLLGSKVGTAAGRAFAELGRIDKTFDWTVLLPAGLPADVREKIVKLLRLMAGASTLSEAQNALGHALQLLKKHNATWRNLED